jgi:5-methylcytosine-specific restriction endonuclease McrA
VTAHSKQKKKTWKACSEYIRRKFSDENGYCSCVTCGKTKHYKEMQAGHFIPKKKGNAVYFVEENIAPQCYQCNINLGGYGAMYNKYMLETYGQEKIDELLKLAQTTIKFTVSDLKEIETEYKEALERLL